MMTAGSQAHPQGWTLQDEGQTKDIGQADLDMHLVLGSVVQHLPGTGCPGKQGHPFRSLFLVSRVCRWLSELEATC